jgi:SHAQKYF class myb-like DNA-binding protein
MQEQTHPHSPAAPVRHHSPSQHTTSNTEQKVPSSSSLNNESAASNTTTTHNNNNNDHNNNNNNTPVTVTHHISTRPRPTTSTSTTHTTTTSTTTSATQTPSSMACLANTVPLEVRAGAVGGTGTRPLPLHPYPTHVLMIPRKPPVPMPIAMAMSTHVPSAVTIRNDVAVGIGPSSGNSISHTHTGATTNSLKRSRANTTISNSEEKNKNNMGVENNNVHESNISEPDAKKMDSMSRSAHEHSALYSLVHAQEILERKHQIQCDERDRDIRVESEKKKMSSTSVFSQQESGEAIIGNTCRPYGGLDLGGGGGTRHQHHHDVDENSANQQELYVPAGVGACISTSAGAEHEQHGHEHELEHEQQHESTGSGLGVEVQMTVEQIDDLIGKVDLPTNFSFSLPSVPISIAPKPAPVPAPVLAPVPFQPQMCKQIPAVPSTAKSTSASTDLSGNSNSNALKRKAKSGSRKAPVLPLSPKRIRVDTSAGMGMGMGRGMSLTAVRANTNISASAVAPSIEYGYKPASFNNPEQASVGMSASFSSQQPQIRPMQMCTTNTSSSHHQTSDKSMHNTSASTSTISNMHLMRKSPSAGRWSRDEHEAFLDGLKIFGREWKKVATKIPTRTSAQIRSHAQKYFAKLARDEQQQAASASLSLGTAVPGGCASINADSNDLGVGAAGVGSGATVMGESIGGENIISQSVLERVEKILEDPQGAQIEVEETLRKLRARYCELQGDVIRQQQSQQEQQRTEYKPMQLQQQQQGHIEPNVNVRNLLQGVNQNDSSGRTNFSCIGSRSRQSTNIDSAALTQAQNMVEMAGSSSSMLDTGDRTRNITSTSDPSSAGAVFGVATSSASPTRHRSNPITLSSHSLALHSEELIALHVLGGELYRSASRENLRAHDKNNQNIMNQNTQDTVMQNPTSSLQGSSPDTQSSEKTQKRKNSSN